jgi:hypothetical protein
MRREVLHSKGEGLVSILLTWRYIDMIEVQVHSHNYFTATTTTYSKSCHCLTGFAIDYRMYVSSCFLSFLLLITDTVLIQYLLDSCSARANNWQTNDRYGQLRTRWRAFLHNASSRKTDMLVTLLMGHRADVLLFGRLSC